MQWSRSPHRPPHLYMDGAWYFVTTSMVDHAQVLSSEEHFNIWVNALKELIVEFKVKLRAWVALANHYHILFLPRYGSDLGLLMKRLHGRTAFELNALAGTPGRSVWYSYWDTCIRDERDFWTRFNYIHYNPVKHGYVQKPEEWFYSSYRYYVRKDESWLEECLRDFPVHDLYDDDAF